MARSGDLGIADRGNSVICVRQVSERGAHYFADRYLRLRNDIGDLPIRARALGCSRLIVTSRISLPPRVRLAIFKHSASPRTAFDWLLHSSK
jgi:hypothetical protein